MIDRIYKGKDGIGYNAISKALLSFGCKSCEKNLTGKLVKIQIPDGVGTFTVTPTSPTSFEALKNKEFRVSGYESCSDCLNKKCAGRILFSENCEELKYLFYKSVQGFCLTWDNIRAVVVLEKPKPKKMYRMIRMEKGELI